MDNYIFYHCSPINDYYERFLKTFNKIKKYGLLEKINTLFIFLNGNSNLNFQLDDKIKILKSSNMHPNESVTVNYIREFCKKNKGSKILYLHSKGVTRSPDIINQVNSWVDLMEYFLIENFQKCLNDLDKGFYAAGVNYKDNPKHFSGNFWWANADYISSLEECPNNYYGPEMWHLSKCPLEKIKSYFNTNKNLYHTIIEENEYRRN